MAAMQSLRSAKSVAKSVRSEAQVPAAVQPRAVAKPLLAGRPAVADSSSLLVG